MNNNVYHRDKREDEEQLACLDQVENRWDPTPRNQQSDECKNAILECYASGLGNDEILHYLVDKKVDTKSRITSVLKAINPPFCTYIDIEDRRCVVPPAEREAKGAAATLALRKHLNLNDDDKPSNFTVAASDRIELHKTVTVYGIRLSDFGDEKKLLNIEDLMSFVKEKQVEMKLSAQRVKELIKSADDTGYFDEEMQVLLNEESDIKEECFWFKGINYHTKVDAPEEVIEMIKKIRPQLSRLLTAVKIGESGRDPSVLIVV